MANCRGWLGFGFTINPDFRGGADWPYDLEKGSAPWWSAGWERGLLYWLINRARVCFAGGPIMGAAH